MRQLEVYVLGSDSSPKAIEGIYYNRFEPLRFEAILFVCGGLNKNDAFAFLGLFLPKCQNKHVLKRLFMQLLLK